MGVTIHFEGKLKDEAAYAQLLASISEIANSQAWPIEAIEPTVKTLLRVRDEQDWDYTGPVKGVIIYLHEDCDPCRLEFDENLYIQEFVKTQFAGVEWHLKVIELLRTIQRFFIQLSVEDEGEFWESSDLQQLKEHLDRCQAVITDESRKHPSAQVKFKEPDGRIIDLLG